MKLAFERSEDVSNEVTGIIARVSESFLTLWNHSQVGAVDVKQKKFCKEHIYKFEHGLSDGEEIDLQIDGVLKK
ncbi:MAG TPA: hypothetical protein DEG65_03585 [Methylophaga sp.]|nr:hypothetical protein [Methylophaga sp.]HCO00537.1 hypothetical protein [Methylophaga sp.]